MNNQNIIIKAVEGEENDFMVWINGKKYEIYMTSPDNWLVETFQVKVGRFSTYEECVTAATDHCKALQLAA